MVVPWSRTSRAPPPQLLGRPLLFRVFSLQMLNGKDSQEDFKHRLQIGGYPLLESYVDKTINPSNSATEEMGCTIEILSQTPS
jgi:hypothetical protein